MKTLFKFERKFGLSEIIALIAVVISTIAIRQSHLARRDARILDKLDFRPTLSLRAQLHGIDKIPAHINIKNKGAVDAIQVQIKFYFLKYLPYKKKVGAAATGSDLQWTIDRLPPLKQVNIKINETSLATLLPAINTEEHYRILEIFLTYRRDVDLRKYSESAFYFVNPEGKWVGEQSSSLNPETYNPIKEAVFNQFNIQPDLLDMSPDKLHSLRD